MKVTEVPIEIINDLQYNLIDVKLLQLNVLDRGDFILLNSYSTNEEKVVILMELMRNKTEESHDHFLNVMQEDYPWLRDKCEIFLQKARIEALLNGVQPRLKTVNAEMEISSQQDPESIEENDRASVPEQLSPCSPNIMANETKPICVIPQNSAVTKTVFDRSKLNQVISSEMMTLVRRNHRIVRRWTTLAHNLGMTPLAHTLRMRMVLNGEDMDACILYLLEEWKGAHAKEATLGRLLSALREEQFNDVADELEEKFLV